MTLCAGLVRVLELKIVAASPTIVQEIGRDAEEIGPGVRKLHVRSSATKQAKIGLLQDVIGNVLPTGDTRYVPPERLRGGFIQRTECLFVHVRVGLVATAREQAGSAMHRKRDDCGRSKCRRQDGG